MRILIILVALTTWLIAEHESKWSPVKRGAEPQAKTYHGIFKELRELSLVALRDDKQVPRKFEVVRNFKEKANESSSSIDCGVVCELPRVGLKVEAQIHYFFEGVKVPDDIGDSIVVTFNIKGKGDNVELMIGSMDPEFYTKKGNLFRSELEGMGSIDEETWSYTLLAIMNEAECRRLIGEEVERIELGALVLTRHDLIQQGLKSLIGDLELRRGTVPAK